MFCELTRWRLANYAKELKEIEHYARLLERLRKSGNVTAGEVQVIVDKLLASPLEALKGSHKKIDE